MINDHRKKNSSFKNRSNKFTQLSLLSIKFYHNDKTIMPRSLPHLPQTVSFQVIFSVFYSSIYAPFQPFRVLCTYMLAYYKQKNLSFYLRDSVVQQKRKREHNISTSTMCLGVCMFCSLSCNVFFSPPWLRVCSFIISSIYV